jgi:hypothetical protein
MRAQSSDAGSKAEKVRAVKVADPFAALGAVAGLGWAFDASASEQVFGEIALGLDTGVQLLYLGALLTLLAGGSFLVVRQVNQFLREVFCSRYSRERWHRICSRQTTSLAAYFLKRISNADTEFQLFISASVP